MAVWRRRKKALFLFIYQFLVDMEIFLQAVQVVSSLKIPFSFEELIHHTELFIYLFSIYSGIKAKFIGQ